MSNSNLPYSLDSLRIENLFSIKSLEISGISRNSQWIFLTGKNGHGKSLILQAIAAAYYGDDYRAWRNQDGNVAIQLQLWTPSNNSSYIYDYRVGRIFSSSQGTPPPSGQGHDNRLAGYGPGRLQLLSQQAENKSKGGEDAAYGLFFPDGTLLNIELELLLNFYDNKERFHVLCKMFKSLVPIISDIIIEDREVWYIQEDEEEKRPFAHLSAGARSLIAMIGDIFLRLSKEKAEKPRDIKGVVLIDEIELHLHPGWQKALVQNLSKTFPNVQFIVSTHSPIPLLGAPPNSTFIRVLKDDSGVAAEKLKVDIEKLTPNIIFTSPIFDFEGIFFGKDLDPQKTSTEETYDDMKYHNRLQKELDELAKKKDIKLEELFGKD